MIWYALLAQGLIVAHAEHIDRLVVLSANCILLPLGQSIHALPHLPIEVVVAHYYLITSRSINRHSQNKKL